MTNGDEARSPAAAWDRNAARRALDDLFANARQFKSSAEYGDLIRFIARFRRYSPFNAVLIHTQLKGARYVAPANRWLRDFGRRIKTGAQPIVILQPKGPVMFVFDVVDTEGLPGMPPLPPEVDRPFEVRRGRIGAELELTVANALRDGVNVIERKEGSQSAGSIRLAPPGGQIQVVRLKPGLGHLKVPRRYDLLLNASLSPEARYATLVHELAHLYCGHLGTPNEKWWPDRIGLGLTEREFEAESICYLVCERLGIGNPSDEYLAGYLRENEQVPSISLDCVLKGAGLIEQMARIRLPPRKENE